MSHLNLSSILEQVQIIVKNAAKIMSNRDFDIENKGRLGDYVTTVDKAVQKYLKEELFKAYPDITFVGEESDAKDYNVKTLWIVDPIDGTANFIHGMNASAISIGLIDEGESVLGVVYNPYADEMFYAAKGYGAFMNGTPIHVSDRKFSNSLYSSAFCLYRREHAQVCQDIMREVYSQCEDFRRFGTAAIELTQLAAGRSELYFEIRLSPWDYAGSTIIIKEAGGYIGTLYRQEDNSEEFIFSRPIPVFAANTEENFQKLKDILKKYIAEVPYID